jgi:hypothetical protein
MTDKEKEALQLLQQGVIDQAQYEAMIAEANTAEEAPPPISMPTEAPPAMPVEAAPEIATQSLGPEERFKNAKDYFEKKQYDEAVPMLKALSEDKHAAAKYYLALCYSEGKGVDKDEKQTLNLMKQAAGKGDKDAKKWLKEYENKKAVSNDDNKLWQPYRTISAILGAATCAALIYALLYFLLGWIPYPYEKILCCIVAAAGAYFGFRYYYKPLSLALSLANKNEATNAINIIAAAVVFVVAVFALLLAYNSSPVTTLVELGMQYDNTVYTIERMAGTSPSYKKIDDVLYMPWRVICGILGAATFAALAYWLCKLLLGWLPIPHIAIVSGIIVGIPSAFFGFFFEPAFFGVLVSGSSGVIVLTSIVAAVFTFIILLGFFGFIISGIGAAIVGYIIPQIIPEYSGVTIFASIAATVIAATVAFFSLKFAYRVRPINEYF